MAFREPRIPEMREKEGPTIYLRSLVLFLKDFCRAAWTADNCRGREIAALKKRMDALEEKARRETEENGGE